MNEEKLEMWCKQVDRRLNKLEGRGPLIPDTECRKIMRLWADRCGIKTVILLGSEFCCSGKSICFGVDFGLEHLKCYTIDELCGEEETPEPKEPSFIDLDERTREKEGK